jgi:enoyl-CoA hydratase
MSGYETITYDVHDRKAYLTLDRPERLNAINDRLPFDLSAAVAQANDDDAVRVIVLQGSGTSFCAGYDLKEFAEGDISQTRWAQTNPWDPIRDYREMRKNTDQFFSLWRSLKPTIAKVHGHAIAGGSDIALSADILIMADDARIGYPPARVWGCPTTAMWVFRLGAQRAKRMLLTGDTLSGAQAAEWGLALEAVPAAELDDAVEALADRMAGVPTNQLVMQKMMINQAYDNMGLNNTQTIATIFDGITRNSPEGHWFKHFAERDGFHAAVAWRDSGQLIPDGGGELPTPEQSAQVAQSRGWRDKK